MHPAQPAQRIVFRSTAGLVLTGVTWVLCAVGVVSAIITGAGVAAIALLAVACWFVWLVFARPCVITTDEAVQLHNLVRDIEVPYDAIDDLDTRYALRLHAGGGQWSAWSAPAPGGAVGLRDGLRRTPARPDAWRDAPHSVRASGAARAGDAVGTASGAPATVIRRELERRERDGGARTETAVRVRLRVDLIAISTVLVGIALITSLLGA